MTKSRGIAAESIGGFLDVARVQGRSGLLRAECSRGESLEEGELYILAGQPIYARTGTLLGYEALNYLLNWRKVYFSFSTDVPRPPANISPMFAIHPLASSMNTSLPGSAPSPVAPDLRWNIVPERNNLVARESNQSLSGKKWLVPQKARLTQDIQAFALTRRQRLVYLLVDGQRTIGDLARTTGKTVADVELILNELGQRGLVVV